LCFVLAGILLAAPAVKAQSSREKSAASYFARGIEWQARGEFDRAIADFGIAIAFDPHFARAYYMRGRAHLSNGCVSKRRPRPTPISRSASRSIRI
jgi:tetratricopeptide (TPR) repeat protein